MGNARNHQVTISNALNIKDSKNIVIGVFNNHPLDQSTRD